MTMSRSHGLRILSDSLNIKMIGIHRNTSITPFYARVKQKNGDLQASKPHFLENREFMKTLPLLLHHIFGVFRVLASSRRCLCCITTVWCDVLTSDISALVR